MTTDEVKLILGTMLTYGYELFTPLADLDELVFDEDGSLKRALLLSHSTHREKPIVRISDVNPYKYDYVVSCIIHRRQVYLIPQDELDRNYVLLVEKYELKPTDSMLESVNSGIEKERRKFERGLTEEAQSTVEFYNDLLRGI